MFLNLVSPSRLKLQAGFVLVLCALCSLRAETPTLNALEQAIDSSLSMQFDRMYPQQLADWAKPSNLEETDLTSIPESQLYNYVSELIAPDVFNALQPVHRRMLATLAKNRRPGAPELDLCFTPGTDPKAIDAFERAIWGDPSLTYRAANRWSTAATAQPGPLTQGQPTTLTYSFIPEGTTIPSGTGEPAGPSSLFAFLNGLYGSPATWQPLFASVFNRWEQLTGLKFVYEPNDDATTLSSGSPGIIGVRGDIRIGGHFIDGQSGANVLAYNYYPNGGDMVIDTGNPAFFGNTANGSLGFRNVIAHENGHGLGMAHVCPTDQTKLMEPFVSTAYDGPQHDDIQLGTRHYGDRFERVLPNNNNDSAAAAWSLGALANGTLTLTNASIDDKLDTDYFSFGVGGMKEIQITLTPVGSIYPEAGQNPSTGDCLTSANFDSLYVHDLSFQLIGTNGSTVLYNVNDFSEGSAELLGPVPFPLGQAGTYFLRIVPEANNKPQLYDLSITIADHANKAEDMAVFN